MSNEEQSVEKLEEQPEEQKQEQSAKKSVKKGTIILISIIILSLSWYLVSDRFTPYTMQARINGYVVGVSSEVSGVVKQVWVKNNQTVEKGQALFAIDPTQYEIALDKARSQLEDVQRQIAAGDAGVQSAESNLNAKLASQKKAQQDVNRLEGLYRKDPGAISVRRLESSQASYAQAIAKVAGAKSDIVRAIEQKGGEGENNAKLKSALSAVEKAELDLKRTTTYASSRGIISDLRTDVGLFANAGNPMMTFISMHDIWIEAEFTENNLGHMRANDKVELVIDSLPGEVFSGHVRSIGLGISVGKPPPAGTLPSIDNSRDWLRQSQRFPVIISIDVEQKEVLRQFIRIGGQAEVISYTEGHGFLNLLAKFYIRMMSWLSYAY